MRLIMTYNTWHVCYFLQTRVLDCQGNLIRKKQKYLALVCLKTFAQDKTASCSLVTVAYTYPTCVLCL